MARSAVVVCLCFMTLACEKRNAPPPPPPIVSIAPATQRDVPVYVQFAGTLDSYVNAEVRARVAGTILEQNYRDGSFVKAGDLLFTIDPEPLQAAKRVAAGQ